MEASRQINGDGGELDGTGPHLYLVDPYSPNDLTVDQDPDLPAVDGQPATGEPRIDSPIDSVRLFLREISRYPLLTEFDEIRLAKLVENGDPVAKRQMIESNLGLVVSIANHSPESSQTFLDNIQEGVLGLIRAVEKFDWRRKVKFSTYADYRIREAIARASANKSRTIHLPVPVVARLHQIYRAERTLTQELGRFPTDKEIGTRLRLTRDQVEQIKTAAKPATSLNIQITDGSEFELGELVVDETVPDPVEVADANYRSYKLHRALGALPAIERRVLHDNFGLGELAGRNLTGDQIAISEKTYSDKIYRIKAKALAAMAQDPSVQQIRDIDTIYIKDEPATRPRPAAKNQIANREEPELLKTNPIYGLTPDQITDVLNYFSLPDNNRYVLDLRHGLSGEVWHTNAEIAEMLGQSEPWVASNISKSYHSLKGQIWPRTGKNN